MIVAKGTQNFAQSGTVDNSKAFIGKSKLLENSHGAIVKTAIII